MLRAFEYHQNAGPRLKIEARGPRLTLEAIEELSMALEFEPSTSGIISCTLSGNSRSRVWLRSTIVGSSVRRS